MDDVNMRFKGCLLPLLALVLLGCEKELPPVPEPKSRPAKVFTVSLNDTNTVREFPAIAEAGDKAALAFRVQGQLMSLPVVAGKYVQKGDVLAQLNPDEYVQLMKQAKAQFLLADVQYKRYKQLRKDKVVSEQDFDKAVANHKSAQSNLDQAQANVDYTTLKAPYDGNISLINIENHEFVAAQQGVMNIQTSSVLKVVFLLPEYLLRRFGENEVVRAEMLFDTFPNQKFPIEFQEIDTEADAKTNSYKVTMVMERPQDVGLLPGMSGSVELEILQANASRLPAGAVEGEGSQTWVWRLNGDNVVEKTAVKLDEANHVLDGLSDGDRIVVAGGYPLEDGMVIREWVKERGL
ncbi:putative Secretion protein HlyD [Vibrio tapetis subsp. tapetis]|uniref:Putative Secretion protein HlyD n=2 Tax=Vibrio tapetis TaxID=52443 RepID=A0A2N8ZAG0_9VIBR|nr:putative Secretion protein HlyD [Vibrio tapetis subsp. tapetis]